MFLQQTLLPPLFYDLYQVLILVILTIIGIILFIGISVLVRRFAKDRYYRDLDQLRRRYQPLIAALDPAKETPEELKQKPGSMRWLVIEELLCKEIGCAAYPAKAYFIHLMERLGYVDWYIRRLNRGNRWKKAIAAKKLSQMENRKAVPSLIAVLDYPDPDVQMVAVRVLGNFREPVAAEHLIRKLCRVSGEEEGVAIRVLKSALIHFGPAIVPMLRESLRHESWKVRSALTDILSEIAVPDALPDLRLALKDPEPDVRAKAARAVGRLSDMESVPLLIDLLGDPSWVVRLHATRSLGMLPYPYAMRPLISRLTDENWQVRAAAAEALRQCGQDAIEPLLTVITHGADRFAREQFMEELQRSTLLEDCIDALGNGATDAAVQRSQAVFSEYVRLGMTSLAGHYMRNHPNVLVRMRLLVLFGQHRSQPSRDKILWLSDNDPDGEVRETAKTILQSWGVARDRLQASGEGFVSLHGPRHHSIF